MNGPAPERNSDPALWECVDAESEAPPQRRRSRQPRRAVVLSVVALIIAFSALLVAVRSLDQANDARDIALVGRDPGVPLDPNIPAATRSGSAAPGGGTLARPSDPAAADEQPALTKETVFTVKYEKQSLTLKPQGADAIYVDLDEPRVNVSEAGNDLGLTGGGSAKSPYFRLGENVQGSEVGAPTATPQDCADKIRTAPVGRSEIPARAGGTLCVMTSYQAARERGGLQRMVVLEVTGVAVDSTVTVQVTAWNITR